MGFQSSFNQLLSTVAVGAAGVKHFSEQKKAEELSAFGQAEALSKEKGSLGIESARLDTELDKTIQEIDTLPKPMGRKGQLAYNKALQELEGRASMLDAQIKDYNARSEMLTNRINILDKYTKGKVKTYLEGGNK